MRKSYEVFGYRVFTVIKTTHADPIIEDDEPNEDDYPEEQLLRLTTSDNSFGFTDYDPVFSERYWEEGKNV
jgi:hypothetical protein